MRCLRNLPALITWACLACLAASPAWAGDWDLKLSRLCQIETRNNQTIDCGGGYDFNVHGGVARVIPDSSAFRSLMSEVGILFAPNILAPAETIGFAGFNFGLEMGFTSVNAKGVATTNNPSAQPYWRAAESVSDAVLSSGDVNSAASQIRSELPPGVAPTITVMARKGFWLPVPAIEFGVGARHLIGSRMWSGILAAKLSLHEGFQNLWLPAFAVRATASRVFGTTGFNVTVAGADASISKTFGIGSTFNIAPYLGYQLLWIIADSDVLDATPNRDAIELTRQAAGNDPLALASCSEAASGDCNAFFTFLDQNSIIRHRIFFGLRANFSVVSLVAEFSYFAQGTSGETITLANGSSATIKDEAGDQFSGSVALVLDY